MNNTSSRAAGVADEPASGSDGISGSPVAGGGAPGPRSTTAATGGGEVGDAAAAAAPPRATTRAARIDYLDAARAFALVLGIVFHASLSFMPIFIGWAVADVSTSPLAGVFVTIAHSFRMEVFFLLAGFFGALVHHKKGGRVFVRERLVRLGVPFVIGWFSLRPLIVSGWVMGSQAMRGDVDIVGALVTGWRSLGELPRGLLVGSHLWFLYYLMLITGLFLGVRALTLKLPVAARLGWGGRAFVVWLADSRLAVPLLGLTTATALWFMRGWGMDTPDQSLRPHTPVLLIYGGCFALGWRFQRVPGLIERFGRATWDRWLLGGLAVFGVLVLGQIGFDPGHPQHASARIGFVLCYGVMMWALVSLTLGIFRRYCSVPRPSVRYLADSSYWLYLLHLPIVVWLQVAVSELAWPWAVKWAVISLATLMICLVTYDLVVRSTVIGRILNGRRHPRRLFRF